MNLSEKETELYFFIKKLSEEKKGATIKDIETTLGSKALGGLGKLLKLNEIKKIKIKEDETYSAKSTVYYVSVKDEEKQKGDNYV